MTDLLRTGPKHMELQSERCDECNRELRQYWLSLDFKKAGEQKQWSVIVIAEMCRTYLQMARRLMNVGSIDFVGLIIVCGAGVSTRFLQKTKVECISSAQKSFLEYSWCAL